MRCKLSIFFALATASASPALPQDAQLPEGFVRDEWPGTIAVDAQNVCNTDASENAFAKFDPKAWRDEFRLNCWWPVVSDASTYYIRVFDIGSAPLGAIISAEGISRPPIDIWVRGFHKDDRSVSYRTSMTLYRFTCAAGASRYAAIQFQAEDANGEIVQEWVRPSATDRAAVPGSKEEKLAYAVCG